MGTSILLLLVVVGAACGDDTPATGVKADDSETTTTGAPGTDTTGPATTEPPGGATSTTTVARTPRTTTPTTAPSHPSTDADLLLQVRTGGGFVPAEAVFGSLPEFTLLADGRVLAIGPTTMEYPGAALPNLLTGTLDKAAIQAAVDAAVTAGVGGKPDFGDLPVADASSTTFLLRRDGRSATTDVYALGFEDTPTLTVAQRENRRRFAELAEKLRGLGAVATRAYRATAVSVLVAPYPAPSPASPEPAPGSAAWPLGSLATGGVEQFGGRCLSFTGADAAKVLDAAGAARSNTRWTSDSRAWSLTFRPDLPGTAPCATDR